MPVQSRTAIPAACGFLMMAATLPLAAQLPGLDDPPWFGHFAGYSNRRLDFGITSHGKMTLFPKDRQGDRVAKKLTLPIDLIVEETLPDGKILTRKIQPATLTSTSTSTANLEAITVTGKVTGNASFELNIEQNRGDISIGGRITDPGPLTKNPLQLAVRTRFPSAYRAPSGGSKQKQKKFDEKIEDDRLILKWTDGERKRQSLDEAVDAAASEINGPGIASARIEIDAYRDRRFEFTATTGSTIRLSNPQTAPLHKGFTIDWRPDPAKDPQAKSRLVIEIR